jgi:cell wall assembly regulator SMI1
MRQLTWFDRGQAVSLAILVELEKLLGHHLSDDVVEMAKIHSGASNPDECEFEIQDNFGLRRLANFGGMLNFDGQSGESVLGTLRDLDGQLPSGVIPIIKTGSGDYVCLDYRGGGDATVVYFAHEKVGDESLIAVSRTFTEFLEMLTTPII